MGTLLAGELYSIERRALPEPGSHLAVSVSGYRHTDYLLQLQLGIMPHVRAVWVDQFTGSRTPLQAGETLIPYSVQPSNANSMAADRFYVEFEEAVLDASLLPTQQVAMYPNPLSGQTLHLVLPDVLLGTPVAVVITDARGREVFRQVGSTDSAMQLLHLPRLGTGVYLVTVEAATFTATHRLVRE